MGLYYNVYPVREAVNSEYPDLMTEADYFYFKNLLVLAYRMAKAKGRIPERAMIYKKVREEYKLIKKNPYLKKTYKLMALAIKLRALRPLVAMASLFKIKIG